MNVHSSSHVAHVAAAELAAGRLVVLREGRGPSAHADVIAAGERLTPETVNAMIDAGASILYVCIPEDRARSLGLVPQATTPAGRWSDSLMVSVEARSGVTTGISAADRARTARVLSDPRSSAGDIVAPGHVFPVAAGRGGVLECAGLAEAATDLVRLAGLWPAAVACDLVESGSEPVVGEAAVQYAERHGLVSLTVLEVARATLRHDRPLQAGPWSSVAVGGEPASQMLLVDRAGSLAHRLIVFGGPPRQTVGSLLVHEICPEGQLLGARRCACVDALAEAVLAVSSADAAMLVLSTSDRHETVTPNADERHSVLTRSDLLTACALDIADLHPRDRIDHGPFVSMRVADELLAPRSGP